MARFDKKERIHLGVQKQFNYDVFQLVNTILNVIIIAGLALVYFK